MAWDPAFRRNPGDVYSEELEDSGRTLVGWDGDAAILQWGSDKPGIWLPWTGRNTYSIIIDGRKYEFSRPRTDAMNEATLQTKLNKKLQQTKNWINEADLLLQEDPSVLMQDASAKIKSLKQKSGKLTVKKPPVKQSSAHLRILPPVSSTTFNASNKKSKIEAAKWCESMIASKKRLFFKQEGSSVNLFAAGRREVLEKTVTGTTSLTKKLFQEMLG